MTDDSDNPNNPSPIKSKQRKKNMQGNLSEGVFKYLESKANNEYAQAMATIRLEEEKIKLERDKFELEKRKFEMQERQLQLKMKNTMSTDDEPIF